MLGNLFRRIYTHPPEPIPREHRRILLLIGAAYFIASYDVNVYGLAIPQIQKTFGIAEADVSRIIFVFRLAMIPALGLAYLADRIGRRNLLLATLAGASVATLWTAFTHSTVEFVAAQTLARVFGYTEEAICIVVIAEEFSERTRGWATGRLGALAACGAGFAALVFGFVTYLPNGWRDLYALGALPLLGLLWARSRLPETKRFAKRQALKEQIDPLLSLIRNYPGRLAILACVAAPYSFAMSAGVVFVSKFLQTDRGWTPGQVSALILCAGAIAILGNIAAGAWSDRFGRRVVLSATIPISAAAYALFYIWASGVWLIPLWIVALFTWMATDILISGLSAELFPTSHRSLASAIRLLVWLSAGGIGFLVEAELFEKLGNHGAAITLLTAFAPLSILPVLFLPEPAQKSLEEIAPDHA